MNTPTTPSNTWTLHPKLHDQDIGCKDIAFDHAYTAMRLVRACLTVLRDDLMGGHGERWKPDGRSPPQQRHGHVELSRQRRSRSRDRRNDRRHTPHARGAVTHRHHRRSRSRSRDRQHRRSHPTQRSVHPRRTDRTTRRHHTGGALPQWPRSLTIDEVAKDTRWQWEKALRGAFQQEFCIQKMPADEGVMEYLILSRHDAPGRLHTTYFQPLHAELQRRPGGAAGPCARVHTQSTLRLAFMCRANSLVATAMSGRSWL